MKRKFYLNYQNEKALKLYDHKKGKRSIKKVVKKVAKKAAKRKSVS